MLKPFFTNLRNNDLFAGIRDIIYIFIDTKNKLTSGRKKYCPEQEKIKKIYED